MAIHNTIFLGQQNQLLRDINAKQTIKHAKSIQQLPYRGGYIARETNEPVVVEKNAKKPAEPAVSGPSETTQSLPHRAPPRCTECWGWGHRRNHCPKRTEQLILYLNGVLAEINWFKIDGFWWGGSLAYRLRQLGGWQRLGSRIVVLEPKYC